MAEPKRPQTLTNNSGIINPLFDGLVYNTGGYFYSLFSSPPTGLGINTTQLAKISVVNANALRIKQYGILFTIYVNSSVLNI